MSQTGFLFQVTIEIAYFEVSLTISPMFSFDPPKVNIVKKRLYYALHGKTRSVTMISKISKMESLATIDNG